MSTSPDKVPRPYRRHRRENGRLVPVKREDAARNARPHKVFVSHAGNSRALLKGALDRRSAVGKAYAQLLAGYRAHLGAQPTLPQERLIDQCARFGLLTSIAWAELTTTGLFRNGAVSAAFDALLKASRDERECLRLLGITQAQRDAVVLDVAQEIARQNHEDAKHGSAEQA